MKRTALAFGLVLALAVAPAAAQTRVSVAVGFGVPRPYVSGIVVVGRPYVYRPYFYRPPLVVVVPRPYPVRPLFVDRVFVTRARIYRHHHRHHRYGYDDDESAPPVNPAPYHSERARAEVAGAAPDALGGSARYGGQAGGVARTPPAFFFLLRGRVCRLAAKQLAKERGCRGQRYDEDLLQPNQGGEQHLEEPCLRGDAPGDQRGNAVFGDLVGTRDEVGVAVPLVELDETHHLAHRALDRLELVHRGDRVEYQDAAPPEHPDVVVERAPAVAAEPQVLRPVALVTGAVVVRRLRPRGAARGKRASERTFPASSSVEGLGFVSGRRA